MCADARTAPWGLLQPSRRVRSRPAQTKKDTTSLNADFDDGCVPLASSGVNYQTVARVMHCMHNEPVGLRACRVGGFRIPVKLHDEQV